VGDYAGILNAVAELVLFTEWYSPPCKSVTLHARLSQSNWLRRNDGDSRHLPGHRKPTACIEVPNTFTRSSVWSRMNCAGRGPLRLYRNLI